MGWKASSPRDTAPTQPYCLAWEYLSLFQGHRVLLCSAEARALWPSGMLLAFRVSDSPREEKGSWSCCPTALHGLLGHSPALRDERALFQQIFLSLLCVGKMFRPVLDYTVFSLATPIQKCLWTSTPAAGWHCDDLCSPPCSWSPPLALRFQESQFLASILLIYSIFPDSLAAGCGHVAKSYLMKC